jgi:hypothetical protein
MKDSPWWQPADYGRIRPFAQFLGASVTEIAGLDLRILRRKVARSLSEY